MAEKDFPPHFSEAPMKKLRIVFIVIFCAVLAFSLYKLGTELNEQRKSRAATDEALEIFGIAPSTSRDAPAPVRTPKPSSPVHIEPGVDPNPELEYLVPDLPMDEPGRTLADADLAAVQEVNPDVVGWIYLPDSPISYPLLQGTDNEYYLRHNWKRVRNDPASIFLDYRAAGDFSDFDTIIYGHRMKSGSMFGTLKYFESDAEYLDTHPSFYIRVGDEVFRYDVFALVDAPLDDPIYEWEFTDDISSRGAYIAHTMSMDKLHTGIYPTPQNRIVTLVTCTGRSYTSRLVLQLVLAGRLVDE
jgi:sortase B